MDGGTGSSPKYDERVEGEKNERVGERAGTRMRIIHVMGKWKDKQSQDRLGP